MLDSLKAIQESNIPLKLIKENSDLFAETICKYFNESLERSKFPDAYWNVWTNIKKFYAQNNIFKKEYEILNHLYFGLNFIFSGTAIGRFRQIFLLIFSRRPTMAAVVFTQPPLIPHPPPPSPPLPPP